MSHKTKSIGMIGVLRTAATSFFCTFGGWCVGIIYTHVHFYFLHQANVEKTRVVFERMGMAGWQPQAASWLTMPAPITSFSWIYIVMVWCGFVAPLFVAVKSTSLMWKWPITTMMFGTVGALAMVFCIRYQWAPIGSIGEALVLTATIMSAATGLFCSLAKRRQLRKERSQHQS